MEDFGKKKKKKKNYTLQLESNITTIEKNDDYDYDFLIKRAFDNLPSNYENKKKFILQNPRISISNKSTKVTNFPSICSNMGINADSTHLRKFLYIHIGIPKIHLNEDNELIIGKRITADMIRNYLYSYVRKYKKCSTCKSFDTMLIKKDRMHYVKCDICNAQRCCDNDNKTN